MRKSTNNMQRGQRTAMKRILELGQARLRLSKPFRTSKWDLSTFSPGPDYRNPDFRSEIGQGRHFEIKIKNILAPWFLLFQNQWGFLVNRREFSTFCAIEGSTLTVSYTIGVYYVSYCALNSILTQDEDIGVFPNWRTWDQPFELEFWYSFVWTWP